MGPFGKLHYKKKKKILIVVSKAFKFKNMKNEGTNGEGNLIRSEKSLKLSNVVATQLLLHF